MDSLLLPQCLFEGGHNWCHHCLRDFKGTHYCKKTCYMCSRPSSDTIKAGHCLKRMPNAVEKVCESCNGVFYNDDCFTHHEKAPLHMSAKGATQKRTQLRQARIEELLNNGTRMDDESELDLSALPEGGENVLAPDDLEGEPRTGKANKTCQSLCQKFWYCPSKCGKRYARVANIEQDHVCFSYKCHICRVQVMPHVHHLCYVRALDPCPERVKRILCFDFESMTATTSTCKKGYVFKRKLGCACTPERPCNGCRKCINCNFDFCGRPTTHTPNLVYYRTNCDKCYPKHDYAKDAKCDFLEFCVISVRRKPSVRQSHACKVLVVSERVTIMDSTVYRDLEDLCSTPDFPTT